ncbi:hypothetical protein YC2023_114659 [Brassica napus]
MDALLDHDSRLQKMITLIEKSRYPPSAGGRQGPRHNYHQLPLQLIHTPTEEITRTIDDRQVEDQARRKLRDVSRRRSLSFGAPPAE